MLASTAGSAMNVVGTVSPDSAKESVKQFMNDSKINLNLGDEISLPTGNFYIVGTDSKEFWVNKDTGIVERATFYSEMSKMSDTIISKEKCQEIALSYAIQHYIDFETRNLQLNYQEFHDTGIDYEYTFIWHGYQQDIETPSFILVTVNANTGNIIEYVGLSREVNVDLKSTISSHEAMKIASDYFDNPYTESVELKVVNINPKEQHLVWAVNIHDTQSEDMLQGGIVEIDAENGKILRVFKWL